MRHASSPLLSLAVLAVLTAAGCGGGGGAAGPAATPAGPSTTGTTPTGPTATTQAATVGVWEGTVTSQVTGQSVPMMGFADASGTGAWVMADGRVFGGPMPAAGAATAMLGAHMGPAGRFPDGSMLGPMQMTIDGAAPGMMDGRFAGVGDRETFHAAMSPVWNRPASLADLAGVYARTNSAGYSISVAIDAAGRITANDSRGCVLNGTASVPDPAHNLYRLNATVTSCGAFDGTYAGMGTLLDVDAMKPWLERMRPPLDPNANGGTGGGMMGGGMMGGPPPQNAIPSGAKNLFMFALFNGTSAIMDAVAK
jgi:hypothetical protein